MKHKLQAIFLCTWFLLCVISTVVLCQPDVLSKSRTIPKATVVSTATKYAVRTVNKSFVDTFPESDIVAMTLKGGKKYNCVMPRIVQVNDSSDKQHEQIEQKEFYESIPRSLAPMNHKGATATPIETLVGAPQRVTNDACFYRVEGWWSYELCYKQFVKQFHFDYEQQKRTQEFVLGRAVYHDNDEELNSWPEVEKRIGTSITVDGQEEKYYSELYTDGTTCDLTGEGRSTEVRYFCPRRKVQGTFIISITEPSSCHYVMEVRTSLLCDHPLFHQEEVSANDILCYSTEETGAEGEGKLIGADVSTQNTVSGVLGDEDGTYSTQRTTDPAAMAREAAQGVSVDRGKQLAQKLHQAVFKAFSGMEKDDKGKVQEVNVNLNMVDLENIGAELLRESIEKTTQANNGGGNEAPEEPSPAPHAPEDPQAAEKDGEDKSDQ